MNKWTKTSAAKKYNHFLKVMLWGRCTRSAIKAKIGTINNPKRIECVKPRWANNVSGVLIQNPAKKSISGMLWASMPHSIAFLPNPFSKKASPMQAPNATWVSESKFYLVFIFLIALIPLIPLIPLISNRRQVTHYSPLMVRPARHILVLQLTNRHSQLILRLRSVQAKFTF